MLLTAAVGRLFASAGPLGRLQHVRALKFNGAPWRSDTDRPGLRSGSSPRKNGSSARVLTMTAAADVIRATVHNRVDNQMRGASLANHRHRRLDRSHRLFSCCRVSWRDQSLRPSHTVVTSQTVRRYSHAENALAADDQVRVAELVPQIAGFTLLAYARSRCDDDERCRRRSAAAITCSSIVRCVACGSCRPVMMPFTDRTGRRADHQAGPAFSGGRRFPARRSRSRARARPSFRPRSRDARRACAALTRSAVSRGTEELFVRRLVVLEAGDTGVEQERRDLNAAARPAASPVPA